MGGYKKFPNQYLKNSGRTASTFVGQVKAIYLTNSGDIINDDGQRTHSSTCLDSRHKMNNRVFISITLLFLLTNCAQKRPYPEAAAGGIRFSFLAPLAKSVAIAGSFNRWDPGRDRLTGPDRNGIWTILLPLSHGRYEYRFVINNSEWILDPSAPSMDDGLGEKNSIVIVPP